jgi:type IV pilus assembly protein PilW
MRNNRGFTLVELMVAMAISLIVMGSIYSVYQTQQKSYILQEQVSAMQQNLRAGMTMLTRDIRMAGYNPIPLGSTNPLVSATTGITVPTVNDIQFTRIDNTETNQDTIIYRLFDKDGDGDMDLVRDLNGGGDQMVAENIDALDFVYLDANGAVIADPAANLPTIRSIQVTMIARTGKADIGYVNNNSYSNQQGTPILPAQNDNNRRRVLTREIQCRNLGL